MTIHEIYGDEITTIDVAATLLAIMLAWETTQAILHGLTQAISKGWHDGKRD